MIFSLKFSKLTLRRKFSTTIRLFHTKDLSPVFIKTRSSNGLFPLASVLSTRSFSQGRSRGRTQAAEKRPSFTSALFHSYKKTNNLYEGATNENRRNLNNYYLERVSRANSYFIRQTWTRSFRILTMRRREKRAIFSAIPLRPSFLLTRLPTVPNESSILRRNIPEKRRRRLYLLAQQSQRRAQKATVFAPVITRVKGELTATRGTRLDYGEKAEPENWLEGVKCFP